MRRRMGLKSARVALAFVTVLGSRADETFGAGSDATRFAGLSATVLPAILSGAEDADREAVLLWNTASRFYGQKNWKDAARTFQEFLERFPGHEDAAEARFARGYCLNRLGDHAAAVEALRLAARDGETPWAPDASFYLGRSLEALGMASRGEEAERVRRLVEAGASYGVAAGLHGELARKARSLVDAKRPEDVGAEEWQRRIDEASRDSEQHRDLTVLALGAQGEVLYQAAKYAESAKALGVLAENPEPYVDSEHYHRALYVLGLSRHALAMAGGGGAPRYREARDVLRRAAEPRYEGQPLWEEAAYLTARLAHQDGDLPEAIEGYGRVVAKRAGRAPEAAYHRGLALCETRTPDGLRQGREELSRFAKDYPEHALAARARLHEAQSAFDLKDYPAAASLFGVVAEKSPDFSGRALLRQGQALLLKAPPDAERSAEALSSAVARLEAARKPGEADGSGALLAEALYWLGEAHLARGDAGLLEAAAAFGKVRADHAKEVPELAEKALYQEARSLQLSGKLQESHAAASLYRKLYPPGKGVYHAETLLLSAECAFHAAEGELPEAVRREAPRFYREARESLGDPLEARRAHYMEGLSLYFLGEFGKAAAVLEDLWKVVSEGKPEDGKEYPELPFYLADSLTQGRPPGEPSAEDRARYRRAVGLYQQYVADSRDGKHLANALVNLGLAQEWLEEYRGAEEAFKTFLDSFSQHELVPQVYFELGNARLRLGDFQGAEAAYAAAAERLASRPAEGESDLLAAKALYQKALLERRGSDPTSARETLSKLLQTYAERLRGSGGKEGETLVRDADHQRALALLEAGSAKEARDAMARHLETYPGGPHDAELRNQLARSFLDDGEPERALEALKPLLEADVAREGRDRALYLAAWCHSTLATTVPVGEAGEATGGDEVAESARRREEAEATYRKLISEHPRSPLVVDAMLELGQQLFNRKAYAEAKKWFEQVRKAVEGMSGPFDPETAQRYRDLLERSFVGLGFIAFEDRSFEEAARLLDQASANEASELAPRAIFQSARALMETGDPAEAAKRFRKVADELKGRAGPLHEESLLRLAECHHQLGEYQEALREADRLLAEYPDGKLRHEARFARGFAQQFLGEGEKAIASFREVVAGTGAPVAARAQYHIGECLVEEEKYREAAREYAVTVANFDFGGEYDAWVRRSLLAAGMAYQSAGDLEAARTQYRELVERFSSSDEGKAAAERLQALEGGKES